MIFSFSDVSNLVHVSQLYKNGTENGIMQCIYFYIQKVH